MANSLPNDILFIVCSQLSQQRDFHTLLQCALTGKQLATPALTLLYRMHEVSPVTTGSDEDHQIETQQTMAYTAKLRQQEQIIRKWAGLWRSLILSSLDQTLYPYSTYIRVLNLQDLSDLLIHGMFRAKIKDHFFRGEFQRFKVEQLERVEFIMDKKTGKEKPKEIFRLDVAPILSKIGEVITAKTPLLEELRGYTVSCEAVRQWLAKLLRLKHLIVWDGETLRGLGQQIRVHCPQFATLKFWQWQQSDADATFAAFLNDIRPQSIESLAIHSGSTIASMSFHALGTHSETLTDLALKSLNAEAMQSLNVLKACTKLTSLSLEESQASTTDLEHRHNDVFLEIVAWLQECKSLKKIQLSRFFSGPALLAPLLMDETLHIRELELDGYVMRPAMAFHRALAHHTSLRSLSLKGEGDENGREGYDILTDSICQLDGLTDLRLQRIADYFHDDNICRLARSLPKLEVLVVGGWYITDAVLEELRALSSLKMLQFNAITKFTTQAIMEFVLSLGPGNMGFALSILMSDMDGDLAPHERQLIAETLETQLKGRFEFMTLGDPEESDFEGDDSD